MGHNRFSHEDSKALMFHKELYNKSLHFVFL